jgi:hypothetical protein
VVLRQGLPEGGVDERAQEEVHGAAGGAGGDGNGKWGFARQAAWQAADLKALAVAQQTHLSSDDDSGQFDGRLDRCSRPL